MISQDEALTRILAPLSPLSPEVVGFADACGRVLAAPVTAARTQPPCDVSAMDGYAVRAADADAGASLAVIGESQAGRAFDGTVERGEAVRIFTGAAVPAGADAIVLQEDTETGDSDSEWRITVTEAAVAGRHIRRGGIDFKDGGTLLAAGHRLGPRDLTLMASAQALWVRVTRRRRIGLRATGNELVMPGETPGASGIVSSTPAGLAAYIAEWGGEPVHLGIANDDAASLRTAIDRADGVDMIVTLGGASVGDYDLVQSALSDRGLAVDFWKVAIKPGKPLIYGALDGRPFLGLPGNPVSALVCALLFLRPAIGALLGLERTALAPPLITGAAGSALKANGGRQDYMRGTLDRRPDGPWIATPFALQDSSVQSLFACAGCLIVRPAHAPAAKPGDPVTIWPL